jgi:hypothetical protein
MTIPFLDDIEKVINEHGSSLILKERITLAQDQYSILERQKKDLDTNVVDLKAKNSALEANLEQAQIKIRNLEKQLAKSHELNLPKDEEKVLKTICENTGITDYGIAQSLDANPEKVQYWLGELHDKKLASPVIVMRPDFGGGGAGTEWRILHEGRRYLIEHDLL